MSLGGILRPMSLVMGPLLHGRSFGSLRPVLASSSTILGSDVKGAMDSREWDPAKRETEPFSKPQQDGNKTQPRQQAPPKPSVAAGLASSQQPRQSQMQQAPQREPETGKAASSTQEVPKSLTVNDYNLKLKHTVSFFSSKEKPLVLESVIGLCNAMKVEGIKPDVKTYNSLMEGLATRNEVSFALKMVQEMIENNVTPDIFTINLLIKMHAPFGDFLGAMSIFELLDTFSIQPTAETFFSLVEVAASSPAHNFKVESLVKEMLNLKLYTMEAGSKAIDALALNLHGPEGFALLKLIEKENERVSMAAYSSLLHCLTQTEHKEGVNHCFKVLRSGKLTDVVLDEGMLLSVLAHARRTGDLDLAHQAVLALEESKPVYQDFHFLHFLDLLAEKGSFFRLFEIVLLMKSMGIELKLKAFNEVMYEIGKSPENMDKAFFALEDLKTQKSVDPFIFNVVLGGCAQGKDLDRTFATFAEAENLGVEPNLETFHMLLEVCARTRQKKVGERVWKELEASGLPPTSETYGKYIDVGVFSADLETPKQMFDQAISKGMTLPEGTYVRLIMAFGEHDKKFTARVADHMQRVAKFSVGNKLLQGLETELKELQAKAEGVPDKKKDK